LAKIVRTARLTLTPTGYSKRDDVRRIFLVLKAALKDHCADQLEFILRESEYPTSIEIEMHERMNPCPEKE